MKDYSFIATHKPSNITASKVLQKGVEYTFLTNCVDFHSDTPLPLLKTNHVVFKNPNFEDLTGKNHGYFQVMGLVEYKSKIRWLVRCSCGNYEIRSSKSIKNHDQYDYPEKDMCLSCDDIRKIRILAMANSQGLQFEEFCEKYLPRHVKGQRKKNEKNKNIS